MASSAVSAAAIGGGIGAAGGLLNTAISAGINAAAASKAHDRQKNMMTRGPTYIMQGLRDAGINPILAAGSAGLGGSAAKVSQAHAARGTDSAMQGALAGSQIRLQDAATAKAIAEKDIIQSRQPFENWKAQFYASDEGQRLIKTSLENEALPKTWPAAGARGLYKLFTKGSSFFSPPPHSVEDNQ